MLWGMAFMPPSPPPGLPRIKRISAGRPLHWLVLGWRDLSRNPWLSLLHGAVAALAGLLIALLAHERFWLLAGSVSGFMVVAPVLATGLYAMSRAQERGETVNLSLLVRTWTGWWTGRADGGQADMRLIRFGMLLGLAGSGWVLTSSALITLLSPLPVHTPLDFIRHVVLAHDHPVFEIWLAMGGLLAAPVFASSVVAIPLLLDRQVGVLPAVLTSWKAVLAHPLALAVWAFVLMGFSVLGMASLFLGLVWVVPMLGHASWHAYRDLIDADALPEAWLRGEPS